MDATSKKFWSTVDIRTPDECWTWNGHKDKDNYGTFYVREYRTVRAHRFAYENYYNITVGKDMLVCHRCDNASCCNPKHLFEGTIQDNVTDKMSKGRHGYGVNSRYNDKEVTAMRLLYSCGMSTCSIAKRFKGDQGAIWRLLHNFNYIPKGE
jgi:hypothetical protein